MEGRMVYGDANLGAFFGSRSMMNFGNFHKRTLEQSFCQPLDVEGSCDEDLGEFLNHKGKKRRLTTDQVQLLEKSFQLENKLELERKVELARDLGLQPKQVAIWFQNRRARWKNKQLEMDYEALKSAYNMLKVDYENLLKEEERLKTEVLSLTNKLLIGGIGNCSSETPELNYKSHNADFDSAFEKKSSCKLEDLSAVNSVVSDSDHSPRGTNGDCTSLSKLTESANSSEDFEVQGYCFPMFSDVWNHHGFAVEEQAFWL